MKFAVSIGGGAADLFLKLSHITKIFLFFSILGWAGLNAQPVQEWASRYNGSGPDNAYSLVTDGPGNVYVTGSSSNGSNLDYLTIKYNDAGTELWRVSYNGPGNGDDYANSVALDNSGSVYVTGQSSGVGTGLDFATVKYSSAGIQQWVARYNGPSNGLDAAVMVKTDALGCVLVAGQSNGIGTDFDYAVVKYSPAGTLQWAVRYNGTGNASDVVKDLAIDLSGNVYATGSSIGGQSNFDYVTIKYSSEGIIGWISRYNGAGNNADVANSLCLDSDGFVYVTGSSTGTSGNFDCVSIKYGPSGQTVWENRFDAESNSDDLGNSIAVDCCGDVYVGGTSFNTVSNYDFVTIKYNSSGTRQWVRTFNGSGNSYDEANHILVDEAGNIYVAGYSTGMSSNFDYTTVKYDPAGNEKWFKIYNGTGNNYDQPNLFSMDKEGNIYVTGSSTGIGTGLDYATIKYSQTVTGIQPHPTDLPGEYNLSQNYPNPFNPTTKIRFSIPPLKGDRGMAVKLTIFDILGRQIETLVNKELQPGKYSVEWKAAGMPSGAYFYRLLVEDSHYSVKYQSTRKMLLVK